MWEANQVQGIMVLTSCPAGHQLKTWLRGVQVIEQECVPCIPGLEYILDPTIHTCQDCPTGLNCHGVDLLDPITPNVSWVRSGGIYELQSCPYGHYRFNGGGALFVPEAQECRFCEKGEECTQNSCLDCTGSLSGGLLQGRSKSKCLPDLSIKHLSGDSGSYRAGVLNQLSRWRRHERPDGSDKPRCLHVCTAAVPRETGWEFNL